MSLSLVTAACSPPAQIAEPRRDAAGVRTPSPEIGARVNPVRPGIGRRQREGRPSSPTDRGLTDPLRRAEPQAGPDRAESLRQSGVPRYRLLVEPRHLWLSTPDGQRLLDLLPRLRLSHGRLDRAPAPRPPRPLPEVPGPWTLRTLHGPDGRIEVTAECRSHLTDHRWQVIGQAGDASVRIEWEIRYRQDCRVLEEAAELWSSRGTAGEVLDRAYRVVPVLGAQITDGLTPRWLTLHAPVGEGRATILDGQGVQTLTTSLERGRVRILIEAEQRLNHPFRVQSTCRRRTRSQRPTLILDAAPTRTGQVRRLSLRLHLGGTEPLVPGRYPRGFGAALVLTDHADQSSASTFEALAFGETGAVASGRLGRQHPGLVNRGLAYSKTVFATQAGSYAPQLDDSAYLALLEQAQARGVEVGLHSISGRPDLAQAAPDALTRFRSRLKGRTWIDHQPDTNCEAVSNRGWDPSSAHYMLDPLRRFGFRYLWAVLDLSLGAGRLNLFAPEHPAQRRPVLFENPALEATDTPFVFFTSARLFLPRKRLLGRLGPRALARLVAERGLHIGHVYIDLHCRRGRLCDRTLLHPLPGGRFRLLPEADRIFKRLAGLMDSGDLWTVGLEAVGDHLLAAMACEVRAEPDGDARVACPRGALSGLTWVLPRGAGRTLLMDGAPASHTRRRGQALDLWMDIEAGQTRRIRLIGPRGHALPIFKQAGLVMSNSLIK